MTFTISYISVYFDVDLISGSNIDAAYDWLGSLIAKRKRDDKFEPIQASKLFILSAKLELPIKEDPKSTDSTMIAWRVIHEQRCCKLYGRLGNQYCDIYGMVIPDN